MGCKNNSTRCNVQNVPLKSWGKKSKMCSIATWYDWKQNITRPDIKAALNKIPLEDELFGTSVSFLSLSPSQANTFANLHEGRRVEIPLRDLNLEAMLADPVFQTNSIDKWLRFISVHANNRTDPLFSLVTYYPFIYHDPVIPPLSIAPPLNRLNAPVLRIGDSQFKGDPNSANGLSHHAKAIHRLSKRLAKLWQKPQLHVIQTEAMNPPI